jgi:hypothetical protein
VDPPDELGVIGIALSTMEFLNFFFAASMRRASLFCRDFLRADGLRLQFVLFGLARFWY